MKCALEHSHLPQMITAKVESETNTVFLTDNRWEVIKLHGWQRNDFIFPFFALIPFLTSVSGISRLDIPSFLQVDVKVCLENDATPSTLFRLCSLCFYSS